MPTWKVGGWDSFWLAFYEAGREIGATYSEQSNRHLDAYCRYAKTGGVAFCFKEIAIVCDRPEKLHFDAVNRLHSITGPAMGWPDGYNIYAWHGTRIPGEWVESPETLDPHTALTWENVEQRRAALAIIGWPRIIRELGAVVIDEDPDPEHGTLVEVCLPDLEQPCRLLRVRCGTLREFALGVPNECDTVLSAQAYLAGRPAEKFRFPTNRT
jgi:hypothetical protein